MVNLKQKAPTWLVVIAVVFVFAIINYSGKKSGTGTKPRSEAEVAAINVCSDIIRKRAVFPSSVEIHRATGVGTDLGGSGGKPRVGINFDAKNSLGNMLPYFAYCDFGVEPPSVSITNR